MTQHGFIHDKLDIKLLVLYILSQAAGPLNRDILLDLAMVDGGVDYFSFMEVLSELQETEHLFCEKEQFVITEKGRKNSAICESSLPYSVKRKALRKLAGVNTALRRNAQVRSEILPQEKGGFTLCLTLDDDKVNLLTIQLLAPTREGAEQLAENFCRRPERIYNNVLDLLFDQEEQGGAAE